MPVVAAVRGEIERIGRRRPPPLASVYLGGGTPSLLSGRPLESLLTTVFRSLTVLPGAEVTLEANPDDVTQERLREWRSLGVGRLSLGVQSLDDSLLAVLGRRHSADQALEALGWAMEEGFQVSVDLIVGVPGLDRARIRMDLAAILGRRPAHLSVYMLEMDKPSPLRRRWQRRGFVPDPDQGARHYLEVCRILKDAGYSHYEVSSFALPGGIARHNTRYWLGRPVLAAGVGACGQAGRRRWGNLRSLHSYLAAAREGRTVRRWTRRLGIDEWRREQVMVRLRLAQGVRRSLLDQVAAGNQALAQRLELFVQEDLIRDRGDRVAFTPRGWLVSNELLQFVW